MFRLLKSSLLIFVLTLFSSPIAYAQSIPGISEPITIVVSPRYPKPDTEVTLTAQSFSTDLNRASITWYSGAKIIKQGTGATSISLPSGKAGVPTSVSVSVVTTDIGTISQIASWTPADITMAWKTDGYLPPFYKGKALELYGSSFRVTAIPEFFTSGGARMDPKTLVYKWKKNGTADPNQSGYGRDSFTSAQSSYVRGGDEIYVEVSNKDNSLIATKTITINPTTADIVFYEESPLFGIMYENAAAGSFNLTEEEVTLRAEPFNISSNSSLGGLSLDWTINGASVLTFKDQNKITLRKAGSTGDQSSIGLLIQHQTKILQGGNAAITINQ